MEAMSSTALGSSTSDRANVTKVEVRSVCDQLTDVPVLHVPEVRVPAQVKPPQVSDLLMQSQGMNVSVENLSVSVIIDDSSCWCWKKGRNYGATKKFLLQGVSFVVRPGDVVALLGPSGAGKTTLLNRLVGRGIIGEVVGRVSYNGASVEKARSRIGYVTQDDIMYETLTPRQNLLFTAEFLKGRASKQQRTAAVEEVMDRLRLTKCKDTVVGVPGIVKGISGGERKRTNVAMSLLGNPSLLLMDEPTSGLDSKMADELMKDVAQIAQQGCTVIATIHQPSEAVFENFRQVILLDAGRIAYYGPVEGLRAKLSAFGFHTPERTPLPELLLDILVLPPEGSDQRLEHTDKLSKLMDSRPRAHTAMKQQFSEMTDARDFQRVGFCRQLSILCVRTALVVRRSKLLTFVRFMQTVMSSVLVSWIFVQVPKDLFGVRRRLFVTFFLVFTQLLFGLLGVVNTFPGERAVFLREVQDRWYHPAAFYFSKVFVDTLMQSFFPIFMALISYWFVGLNNATAGHFFVFYVICAIATNIGSSMGFIVSASVSSVNTGLSIAPGMIMPQLLLCGLFIEIDDLPQPFHSISYIVPTRYIVQAVVNNEFRCEVPDTCIPSMKFNNLSLCGYSPCEYCCTKEQKMVAGGVCPVLTCDDALRYLKLDGDRIWPSGDTVAETVGFNILALLILLAFFRLQGMTALIIAYKRAAKRG